MQFFLSVLLSIPRGSFQKSFCLILAAVNYAATLVKANESISGTYCLADTFSAACPKNHVILMQSALFGRMRAGRCISDVTLGCSHNMLSHMDRRCTGHQQCTLDVNSLEREAQPCNKDYKSYLEASYICVPVADDSSCVGNNVITLEETEGYIVGTTSGVTSSRRVCSYIVQVPTGQKVKLFLYSTDYNLIGSVGSGLSTSGIDTATNHKRCRDQLTLQDETTVKVINPCEQSISNQRVNHVFTSHSNTLLIKMNGNGRQTAPKNNLTKFIIKYTAVGCADITPPKFGRVERDGDNMVVRCNTSEQSWRLSCLGNHWQGHVGNCTNTVDDKTMEEMFGSNIPFQQGLALAIAVGVVVGTVIGALLLVCVYTLRKGSRETSLVVEKRPCHDGTRPNCYVEEDRTNYPALLSRERTHDGGTLYTHVCDTHGISGTTGQGTLVAKDVIIPQPFSTSTTFKLTPTGCLEGGGCLEGSPPSTHGKAVGLDVINTGSGGCNAILSATYGCTQVVQQSKGVPLYDSSASLAANKALHSADVVDNGYPTSMYFDLAEPGAHLSSGGISGIKQTNESHT